MASLRDTVKDYQDELRDGIAWVAFWKQGRSWNAEYFHLDMDDTLYPEDRSRLEEIKSIDPAAVILNGYYCGHLGEDMSLDELTAGVRYHYENSMNDIDGFIGAHDDRLPPEVIEEARAAAHEAGLPFSEKPYRDGEDFNPYVFDGSMSIEDFELMHRMIEKERSEQMAEPILSGYLSNLGKYTEGRPAGEWVTFPTTAEHLKEVFDRIGIDFKHYEEWHFTEFQSTIPGLTEHLSEYSHPDELNYLGKLLEMQFDDDREKFIAAIEYGDHADSLQDIINLAQNLDCYWIYPSVHNEEEYGRYLVDELEEPDVYAAGKSELRNVQLILQQVINDLDHALNGHGLLSDDQTAVRICGGKLCLKRLALHNVVGMSVFDALFLVYVKDRRQQGVILPQDQRVVKVFQNVPCGFLNFIAGEHHVHAGIHAVLHFNGQNTRMAVQVLGFALEPIKAVCILQV